jgi:manganese/iron transport system permease protein
MIFSPIFGVISCLVGFCFSFFYDFPIGASIVIVSSLMFAVAILMSPKRKKGKFLRKKNKKKRF